VLAHESLGRVIDPGQSGRLKAGDLVVGSVRRPDPVPCPNCAVGEWDMCRNGQYTERGIKAIDGFMSERWRIEPEYVMKVDRSLGLLGVLLEPTTVVTKAWEQVGAVGHRAFWDPCTVLVTGAGHVLAHADPAWLARLVTRCEPPDEFKRALQREPDDIKDVVQFAEA
jgi:glucose 1-dehydrogenase